MEQLIFENRIRHKLAPEQLDDLLSQGWRHFGPDFFRYNMTIHNGQICGVIPLRIDLLEYAHDKNARKMLSKIKQAGFTISFCPFEHTSALEALFLAHRERFSENVPESLRSFVGEEPLKPFVPMLCCVYDKDTLIAASILDEGSISVSSVYGMFLPEYGAYSLGKVTMLLEIEYAKAKGMAYYYHGYCYSTPSFYDYKKRFKALYAYNWLGKWHHMDEGA